jgi:hypothetical protein
MLTFVLKREQNSAKQASTAGSMACFLFLKDSTDKPIAVLRAGVDRRVHGLRASLL